MPIEPFRIAVPEADIEDLKERLRRTRWPDQPEDVGWDHGTDNAYLRGLMDHWRDGFDWRAAERRLNGFAQFTTDIGGQRLHFIHERAKRGRGVPLILTHGWPGSVAEMTKIIPLLTGAAEHGGDPDLTFDVVVPSLPGYGFSDRPRRTGTDAAAIAALWAELMSRLGHERFAAQGGDHGAAVTSWLGFRHAERLIGIHLNYIPGAYRPPLGATENMLDEERAWLAQRADWIDREGGYAHIQATRPQTLGYAMMDSPVGLAAWIVEKFRNWSDCGGDVESVFGKDELLTNISIYWFTRTIASSFRLYREIREHPPHFAPGDRIAVPTAIAHFPREIGMPPRHWVERVYTGIQRWTEMPRGGHFAAWEQPQLLADDLRAFLGPLLTG